jgi:tRNA (guanine37-N1)-methyltransferase
MANYDVVGNIVIVKFPREAKSKDKKEFAEKYLKEYPNVRTVLEKSAKFKGRLRTQKTKFLAGEKTKEALYNENGCTFRLNVDTCYFSPRLNSERKEIALLVKPNENVLVMFAGVAPFSVVIAKLSKAKKVVSVELNRECTKYAHENVKKNKLTNVQVVQGDVKKVVPKLTKPSQVGFGERREKSKDFSRALKEKFDRIVMPRPQLKDSFLPTAFKAIKKGGTIHYYGFYPEIEVQKLKELIETEAKKAKKKIKILRIKKAGEVAMRKFRFRVDFKVV